MTKGDRMRARILAEAETLFYEKGYERATLDELLGRLGLSKGGFYHHFASKEALLEAICVTKAEATSRDIDEAVRLCPGSASDRINAMFDKNGLWQEGHTDFLGLLIRVGYADDNLVLREGLKRRLLTLCLPTIRRVVAEGVESGEFRTPYPDGVGSLVLQLGGSLSDSIAYALAGPKPPNTASILEAVELYRFAIEQVLQAPPGVISLYQMRSLAELCNDIYRRRTGKNSQ